jgi:hypothetical protein
MIYIKSRFQHQFLQIAITDPVFAIPPDTTQNHLSPEMTLFEI